MIVASVPVIVTMSAMVMAFMGVIMIVAVAGVIASFIRRMLMVMLIGIVMMAIFSFPAFGVVAVIVSFVSIILSG